ncbi:MAG TPA: two-component sensor histidine kinase, partial [Micavibrio sp.]
MAVILIFAALASGIATYAALTETPPFGKDTDTILWLLNVDLIILLVLVSLVAQRMVGLWSGRRRGQAGSRLHVRLVFIFSLLAVTPAIIMTIFSAVFFHFGLQSWFSAKIHNAISQSEAFAEAYMTEHQQVIRADILAMANDLDRSA